MHGVMEFHVGGLKEGGVSIPEGKSSASWILV
jgi:hypothetical protein